MADLAVPDWLTKDFFQSCLQAHENQPLYLTSCTVESANIPGGNNYGSQLLRVKVDYKKGDLKCSSSLIIKAPLPNMAMFSEIFDNEAKYYNEFINETYKYGEHGLVPKHYSSPNPHCVVLEDLSASDYVMVNRHNLLDLEHCQHYIKAKAKLNALSVAVHRTNPKIIESLAQISQKQTEQMKTIMKRILEMCFACMTLYLEDKPDFKEYLDILKEANENGNMWEMYEEADMLSSNAPLKALVQLDPWCTNMMFKYNSLGKVENVKLLDFQSIAFTSPVKELVTFMSVSPNLDVRKTKLNSLYHLYCDELNKNLEELKCPERLNFEEMKAEIVSMSPIVMMNICGLLPLVLFEEAVDMNALISENVENIPIKDTPMYKLFQGEHYSSICLEVLNEIAKEGVFAYIKEKMKDMKTK